MLLLLGFACTPAVTDSSPPADSATPSACACEDPDTLAFTPARVGGFDDWSGNAVVWAIDTTANRVLVVAMAYEMGVGTINFAPACDGGDAMVGSWVVSTPPSGADDVADFPLLGTAITTAAGVRSLPQPVGALLLEGDPANPTPTAVYVATGGGVSLLRGDGGGDRLLGAFIFSDTADAVDGHATTVCAGAPRLAGLDLAFPAGGSE